MAGSKKKGSAQAAQPSPKAKNPGKAAVKAKSPLQQVTNAPVSPAPILKGNEKDAGQAKKLQAQPDIPRVDQDRLKILEAKIEALNSGILATLQRVEQNQNQDSKVDVLSRKIDRIDSLLQTIVRNLATSQEKKTVEKEPKDLSWKVTENYFPKEEKETNPALNKLDSSSLKRSSLTSLPASSNSSNKLLVQGCIPIPPRLLRFFMTSMLLVNYLEPPRGGHVERIPLALDSNNARKEYRRDLQDKLAYLCDRVKGGTTITAIGFEEKGGKVIVHAASNCSEKCGHIPGFLKKTVDYLSCINRDNKGVVEGCILDDAISLASTSKIARLIWYAEALHRCLLIEHSWINSDSSVFTWLQCMVPKIENRAWKDLVDYCYEGRKDMFAKIQNLETASLSEQQGKETILHTIGRIGAHRHAASVICNAAALLNASSTTSWLKGAEIDFHSSPPRVQCHLNVQEENEEASLDEAASVIFKGDQDLPQYSEDLQFLSAEWGISMKIADRLKNNREFPTKVHAELVLIEHFDAQKLKYYDDDKYIGCSKPACYLCFQYIQATNRLFRNAGKALLVEPATHNNIYTEWRPPDIAVGHKMESRARQRNEVLGTMTSWNIVAIKKHLLEKCGHRRKPVPDSTNGESVVTDFSRMMYELALKNDRESQDDYGSVMALDDDQESIEESRSVADTGNHNEGGIEDFTISDSAVNLDGDSDDESSIDENDYNSQDKSTSIPDNKQEPITPDIKSTSPPDPPEDITHGSLDLKTEISSSCKFRTIVENSTSTTTAVTNDLNNRSQVNITESFWDSGVLSHSESDMGEVMVERPMEGRGIAWILGYFRGSVSGFGKEISGI